MKIKMKSWELVKYLTENPEHKIKLADGRIIINYYDPLFNYHYMHCENQFYGVFAARLNNEDYDCEIIIPQKTHNIKLDHKYFDDVKSGTKKVELRKNDRDYKVGDILILEDVVCLGTGLDGYKICAYADKQIKAKITHIIDDEEFLQPGYVALSIEVIEVIE